MKNQKFLVSLLFVSLLSFPLICGAVIDPRITNTLTNIVTDAGLLLVVICTLMIIWAAIVMLTAAGSAEKITTARTIILYAVIGLVVGLLAAAISGTIRSWAP